MLDLLDVEQANEAERDRLLECIYFNNIFILESMDNVERKRL